MNIVADASVLVAELLRDRGHELIADTRLRVVVTEEQWNEAVYELDRRLRRIVERGWISAEDASQSRHDIQGLVAKNVIEVVPRRVYLHFEAIALRRVPRDPKDWQAVALALALNAGILTNDHDFLGCGCPTWAVDTLMSELAHL